ncbi:MAG: cofactor-independent phosphoglycerate mutase [Candidatus Aenigmarchaeota archaeon]|nr:cofactor-independent phosphoglycerate mutase [Candidatus Aenigmarchaeota archaeon]
MKYIIFLGDGMADEPKMCKDGKTPLMVAEKPNIDSLAKKGRCGRLSTVPQGMPVGSEIANMSIIGYDPRVCYQGRGVLEAASMGVEIHEGEVAVRCNLICIENDKIKNHSSGHISSAESKELIEYINKELGNKNIIFFPGMSYKHLLVLNNENSGVELTPPHDVIGTEVEKVMPKAKNNDGIETTKLLDSLVRKSWELLSNHPVNIKRVEEGKDPGNSIWPWSPGYRPKMELFSEKYNVHGAVISAVDLIKGLGVYAGMDVINVEGATGLYDTNYEGKADACIEALKDHDFVYVHVEAPDEAGHEGDFDLKVKTIEDFDKRLIGRVLEKLKDIDEDVKIAVMPDHYTPVKIKTHVGEPVPFIIAGTDVEADAVEKYDENNILQGSYGLLKGDEFIKTFLSKNP